ncbi:hypothetical protein H4582DRAFT_2078100 [Lactarius indigo]|nr:hypothetical protein H4582DRAFT_2078100 [Lactarius indigo]
MDKDEWTCVHLFCNILQHTDNAQHAFSTSSRPTLHNMLPALEKLYVEWEKASKKPCYKVFVPALTTGLAKLNEYYQCTGTSDAHLMAMVLNPSSKMAYFKKNWDPDLFLEVEDVVQTCSSTTYFVRMPQPSPLAPPPPPASANHQHQTTGCVNIDDIDSESDGDGEVIDPDRPWFNEWMAYLNSNEVIPKGVGMVHWWGIHGQCYPTWDIVEALQCLKSFIHQDLFFCYIISAAQEEAQLDLADKEPANHEAESNVVVQDGEGWSWDKLVEGLEEEEEVHAIVLTV